MSTNDTQATEDEIELLAEHHPDLLAELQETVCDD